MISLERKSDVENSSAAIEIKLKIITFLYIFQLKLALKADRSRTA